MKYIKDFTEIGMQDVAQVGGKNASLGEMIRGLHDKNIRIPQGFAITADGYWHFIDHNNLRAPIDRLLTGGKYSIDQIATISQEIREMIIHGTMPNDLAHEIANAYKLLSKRYKSRACDVAVRSSATAEDLPGASFAGQQESYLHIRGINDLLKSCKECFASLFTQRAIIYRHQKGFDQLKIALSIGVQKMVRSDLASSGVLFTLDPETGFRDVVVINASYGLGETIVQGEVTPDEFVVFKPMLLEGFSPIIKKKLGQKSTKAVYHKSGSTTIEYKRVPHNKQKRFSLKDDEILDLARMGTEIENYYSRKKNGWSPMDIEWAKDGKDGFLYIVQARPETVHSQQAKTVELTQYVLKNSKPLSTIAQGLSIGRAIVSGRVQHIENPSQSDQIKEGDILVTQMTNPDWVPAMKKAAGIVTMRGGRTCHAAIVSRELGIPAIIGVANALSALKQSEEITLDCSKGDTGYIYQGRTPFEITKTAIKEIPQLPIKLLVNIADPDTAFTTSFLPVDGVGLARIEFIISNAIRIHPLALLHPDKISNKKTRKIIAMLVEAYPDKKQFFIDVLAQGIGMIAAAFYPKPVIVRTSDFKSNEYRDLIGGSNFEPHEENPMLGFRGAARYLHPDYQEAFELECEALKKVYLTMGLTNIIPMIPFVRSIDEAEKVACIIKRYMDKNGLYMMCEIPTNVVLIDQFSRHFNGFSIGSNDLTQLTLGVDRDSALVANLFDERNPSMLTMFQQAIEGAHRNGKKIGICGQAPSDYPELGRWLIERGIDSLSLNQDSILSFIMSYKKS